MKSKKVFLLLFIFLTCCLNSAWSCGPNIPEAVSSYSKQPDAPFENFAKGDLGVLRPTFYQSYLLIAYRYLNGPELDPEEQRALMNFWRNGRDYRYEDNDRSHEWTEAIKKITESDTKHLQLYREHPQSHDWYLNCASDAFETALQTLKARRGEFGENSPQVGEWLSAQQIVFSNCGNGLSIPPPTSTDAAPLIKKDRAYQIAAAYFYAEQFDQAESMFREIAKDNNSPWNRIAPYLAVRTMVRKSDLQSNQSEKIDLLLKAKSELQYFIGERQHSEIHRASKKLLNTVNYRLSPAERMTELSGELLKEHSSENLTELLDDFRYIYSEGIRSNHDLVAWIDSYERMDSANSLQKWQQTRSPHWLLATLSTIHRDDPNLPGLLGEANKISADSHAYTSILYESLRLMIQAGRKEEARKRLAVFLAEDGGKLSLSDTNLFAALRMQLAKNLDEFIIDAKRRPAGIKWPVEDMGIPEELEPVMRSELFFWDSTWIFNRELPLSLLIKTLEGTNLPDNLRKQIAIAAWTKAVLLHEESSALKLARVLRELSPELKEDIDSYISAENEEDRNFAFAYLALKTPGLQPFLQPGFGRDARLNELELYRDNWWCAIRNELSGMDERKEYIAEKDTIIRLPDFITEEETLASQKDLETLAEIGAGPIYLGQIVLRHANSHPGDPRMAEALHLTVRATRYGCSQERSETSVISRNAFKLLHSKYPKSAWTQKTPYWF